MMVLPLSGALVALVTAFTLAEDVFGWRIAQDHDEGNVVSTSA